MCANRHKFVLLGQVIWNKFCSGELIRIMLMSLSSGPVRTKGVSAMEGAGPPAKNNRSGLSMSWT